MFPVLDVVWTCRGQRCEAGHIDRFDAASALWQVPADGVETVLQKSSRSSSHQSSRHRSRDKSRDRDQERERDRDKDWPPEKLSDSHSPVSLS